MFNYRKYTEKRYIYRKNQMNWSIIIVIIIIPSHVNLFQRRWTIQAKNITSIWYTFNTIIVEFTVILVERSNKGND